MSKDRLVSVITPAYNEERYISECIESVLAQSYQNLEYIIVDNCSSDKTASLIEAYAATDSRIRFLKNRKTVPVNDNHNIGFRSISANSAYCKVVDADDYIHPDCLRKMIALAETDPAIGFVGAYRFVGDKLDPGCVPFPLTRMSGREACRCYMLKNGYPFGAPTSILYRSEIVRTRENFYAPGLPAADLHVFMDFLDGCDFGFVHEILAFSRVRPGSEMDWRYRFDTLALDFLKTLNQYGDRYLTLSEKKAATADHLNAYYRRMGMHLWNREGRKFWKYHKDALKELGYALSRRRIAFNAMGYAVEAGLRRLLSS